MTTTQTTSPLPAPPSLPDAAPRTSTAGAPLPGLRRRQPRWILAGVLALALGALGSVLLWNRVAETTTVLRVNDTLYRGHVITSQDLSPVSVGRLGGVDALLSDDLASVIGQQVRTDVAAGSLLPREAIGRPELEAGTAVVGLRLEEGRVPRVPIEPGTPVLLVEAAAEQPVAGGAAGTARAFRAEVHRPMETSADQVAMLVDVTVARRDVEAVARLAAEDRIVLVRSE
ncbi:Chaperone for flagella basal body P-ring formation [Raineyella antarctica]|uniref:Chaperone for flagella basal body P-ring formation n=1 Tax=Raineyella antarctica TaxID=1577474 RepID=A0A1G6HS82_9ACTN|nr:SAF domain-containing protein [Raineyella antarctica]SDB97091.1 Chaperone for flagella basal body P-ring formation [Raineyella antarctica]